MMSLPEARKLAFGVVVGQALVTGLVALVCHVIGGWNAAQSAAIGGAISTVGSLVMVMLAFRSTSGSDARLVTRVFFVGEAAKLLIMITLLVVVLKFMKVSVGALFAGYVAPFFVYWVALANALPPLAGAHRGSGAGRGGR